MLLSTHCSLSELSEIATRRIVMANRHAKLACAGMRIEIVYCFVKLCLDQKSGAFRKLKLKASMKSKMLSSLSLLNLAFSRKSPL